MRVKINYIIILSLMLFKAYPVMGQNNIKLEIIDYLIKTGDLNPVDDKQKYFDNIFAVDLIKFDDIGNRKQGVFKFGANADHVKSYILLKDGKDYQILTLQRLDEDLLKELLFLKQKGVSSNESLKYIEATITVYQRNLKAIPWTE